VTEFALNARGRQGGLEVTVAVGVDGGVVVAVRVWVCVTGGIALAVDGGEGVSVGVAPLCTPSPTKTLMRPS
jgi:hypothetical protein